MNAGRLVVLATLVALVATACGGDPVTDPTSTPSPSSTSTAAPSGSPSPSPTTPKGVRTVEVFFANDQLGDPCEDVFAVPREVPAAATLRGALEALLAGPTDAERAEGYGGWFGPDTAHLLDGVRLDGDRALVSFIASLPHVIPNASASCGSTALLGALDATVTQFPEVTEAWYDLEGDRAAFYGWLQYAAPDDHRVPTPDPSATPSPTPSPPAPTTTPAPPAPAPTAPPVEGAEWSTLPSSAGNVVALTFDAGAHGAAVASILATLSGREAPGTFFLTGRWVTAYPQLAAAIGARHAVGNHTQSHPDLTTLGDEAVRAEVRDAEEAIAAIAGDDPRPWFRFPYGARDQRTLSLVGDLAYRSVRWTVDTLGWKGTSGGITQDVVIDRGMGSLQPGAIVLMHVGSNPDDGSTLDADALPELIDRIRDAGYVLVDLDSVAGS